MSRNATIAVIALGLLAVTVFALALQQSGTAPAGTALGVIKIELHPEKAPETVKNFLQYVDDKHYDGTIFHREIGRAHV